MIPLKTNNFNHMKLAFTIVFLFSIVHVFAQNGSISGMVHDRETGERIPFATVSVLNSENDELVTGSVSNGVLDVKLLIFS